MQPLLFAGAEVKVDDMGQVATAEAGVQPQPRRLAVGENVGIGLPVSSLHIFSRRNA